MAVCFFNKDYDKSFECEYSIKDNGIEVIVNYDIDDEIIPNNSKTIIWGKDTKINNRDILIIDYKNKKNVVLKNAYYGGHSNVYGTPDGGYTTKFFSSIYFSHGDYNKLYELPRTPKVKKIKLFSNAISNFIGYPSLSTIESDEEFIIKLKRESQTKQIEINKDYIKNIIIGDSWNSRHSFKEHNIDIKLNGYIEIELMRRVNYDKVYEFVYELIMFMQLLYPNKFDISKIHVMIDDKYYELFLPLKTIEYQNKFIEPSVKDEILVFLEKCYNSIPYRNSKAEIRNIPYIVLNTSRGIEDNFLMFYRFIECYYKSNGHYNDFISYGLINNYKKEVIVNVEDLTREIISLRNYYAHNGYFIDNKTLEIIYPKIKQRKNPKYYFATDVDTEWIYKKTKILYDIVIDIIFSNMLNYDDYKFNKHF